MTKFYLDKSEYDKWVKNLRYAYKHFDEDVLIGFLVEMVERVIAKAIKRTPAVTGNLRRHWATGNLIRRGNTLGLEIVNEAYHNLPEQYGAEYTGYYASFIEYGYRKLSGEWYQGRFMVTISINEVKALMPREFNARFDAWVKRTGL